MDCELVSRIRSFEHLFLSRFTLCEYWLFLSYFFFFFQAEDGIRDDLVTGVQTCALPISSFLLGALYAVLFTDYLSFYFPALTGWKHFAVAVLVIAVISYINVRGIRLVGRVVTVMELAILAVVLVMCLMSVRMWHHNPFSPVIPPHTPWFPVFGVGFSLGLWLYAGYEQVSSVAEEVEDPQRSYPRALAWVVPLSMATYLLPTACALAALGDWQKWGTGYFSQAATLTEVTVPAEGVRPPVSSRR